MKPLLHDLKILAALLAAIALLTGAAELVWRFTGPHHAVPPSVWAAP